MRKLILLVLFTLIFMIFPQKSHAVIQNLNGQTGQNQSFVNDTNIQINSASNQHTLQWNGLLPISRGGTGKVSFTNGSIPFISGGLFSENNSLLFWDNLNARLGIGTSEPQQKLHVLGNLQVGEPNQGVQLSENGDVDLDQIAFVNPLGQSLIYEDVNNGLTHESPSFHFISEEVFKFTGGNILINDGHDLVLNDASGESEPGNLSFRRGGAEIFRITMNSLEKQFFFDINYDNQMFNFMTVHGNDGGVTIGGYQDQEGTLQVAKEQNGNSTLYVGASESGSSGQRPGCLVMGDSDGDGVTYVTANDGVLSASTTKPSICD